MRPRPSLEDETLAGPKKRRTARAGLLGLFAAAVLMALFFLGYLPRMRREQRIQAAAGSLESARPRVTLTAVRRSPAVSELTLPGSIQAIDETPIYARADGYLRRRLVDIGDRARAGQLLAEIETPELDQQIRQARAAVDQNRAALGQAQAKLLQAKSDLQLAEVTLKRWKTLVGKGVLAQQAGDEKQSAYEAALADVTAAEANIGAAEANVRASEANVQRLLELQGFQKVAAPFAGIITARNVDTGTLISSGGNPANRALFTLAQIDRLRIFVNVPQTYVPAIHPGLAAELSLQEFPRRTFPGKVARTANALDERSHTLLTEVEVLNPGGTLLPGMYAQVKFALKRSDAPFVIPGDALVIRPGGPQVVVVDAGTARYRKVGVGRDFGTEVEITSGLSGKEQLILNPRDDLEDGAAVEANGSRQ